MIIEYILIAVALVVVAIVAFRLKNKKKKKSKPSLYKPRTTESIQSLQVKTESPKAPKPVKVIKVPEKKEKKEFTTKHESEPSAKNERIEPAPRKVINTLDRSALKQEETIVKKEFKLVKKITTAAAPTEEKSKANDVEMELETKAVTVETPIEVKERIPIVVTNFAEFVMDKFDQQYYSVREWDKAKFVGETESLGHVPNLEVEFNSKRTINIALETIWIEGFTRGGLDWAVDFDLKDFKQFFSRKRMPYFIVIGVGGSELKPRELFIVPLAKVETEFLSKADLLHYQKNKVDSNFFYDYSSNILR